MVLGIYGVEAFCESTLLADWEIADLGTSEKLIVGAAVFGDFEAAVKLEAVPDLVEAINKGGASLFDSDVALSEKVTDVFSWHNSVLEEVADIE